MNMNMDINDREFLHFESEIECDNFINYIREKNINITHYRGDAYQLPNNCSSFSFLIYLLKIKTLEGNWLESKLLKKKILWIELKKKN